MHRQQNQHLTDSKLETFFLRYPALFSLQESIREALELMVETARNKGKILICGNGGSAADADHITAELMKSFVKKRPVSREFALSLTTADNKAGAVLVPLLQEGVPVINLSSQSALLSALLNDTDPRIGYAQQVAVYGAPGDLFWGISTSGSSPNIINAAITAKAKGMKILGMTGATGGELKRFCDVCLNVPATETWQVQELHLPIYHALCLMLEEILW